MKKIKIGQIGISHEHASVKTDSLRKLSDVFEIVGIVDDSASASASFCLSEYEYKPYDGIKWLTEDELFNTPGLQAVMIETPNLDLVPTALRCMEHNLAIHMDKPGGDNLEQFALLRKGCEERNLPFQIGYVFRQNPAIQWCIKAVHNNWLGDIFEINANMSHDYGGDRYHEYLGNFQGGIMFNLGCHLIDFIIAMMGRPETITPILKSTTGVSDNIKNNCLTIFEYPHATVSLRACSLEVDGLNRRRLKICGTKGSVELCPLELFDGQSLQMRLTLLEDIEEYTAGIHIVNFGIKHDRYEDELLELARIINGEVNNPYTYEHDYLVQEALLAAAGYTKWNK